jgi:hypothetical protein
MHPPLSARIIACAQAAFDRQQVYFFLKIPFRREPQPAVKSPASCLWQAKGTTMKTTYIAAILLTVTSGAAFADTDCTFEPRAKWMTADAVKAQVEQKGVTVQRIETDDGCYEVHGVRKNGDRVELKLHPITAAVVEENVKYAQAGTAAAGTTR